MSVLGLDPGWIARTVATALDEDLGPAPGRDVTTQSTISPDATGTADLVAREPGVVAGLVLVPAVVEQVAQRLGPADVRPSSSGCPTARASQRGDVLAVLDGRTQVLLVAERTLLNLASRASGVATHTRRWADALEGTGAQVLDTRKTTPGLRALDKYAVRCGGGTNKRMGLYDVAMVKDNHVVAAGSVTAAIDAIRRGTRTSSSRSRRTPSTRRWRRSTRARGSCCWTTCRRRVLREVVAAVRATRRDRRARGHGQPDPGPCP